MSANIPMNFNTTLVEEPWLCTAATCPLSLAYITYIPNLGANILFAAIFGVALVVQVALGIKYKTIGFSIGMFFGLLCEILGYVGRIQMHFNPFLQDSFLMYLIPLTIGPAFLSGAIYLCLSRLIIISSPSLSPLKPRTYTLTFMACDFLALVLQGAGGGLAATADDQAGTDLGVHIMLAGLAWQVFSLALFAGLALDFLRRVRRAHEGQLEARFAVFRASRRLRMFLLALGIATLTIFVRSAFRCAELSHGFNGKLANQEITFMILEGAMIAIAVVCLTIYHPGSVFKETWGMANWSLKKRKNEEQGCELRSNEVSSEALVYGVERKHAIGASAMSV